MVITNETPIYLVVEAYERGEIDDVLIEDGHVISYRIVIQKEVAV